MMKKNVSGQRWRVYAEHRNTGVPATGIAATITATINKDYAGEVATDDANPTEIGGGYYEFALTQAETNAYQLSLKPTTTTNGVQVRACPETLTTETAAAVEPSTLTTSDVDARLAAIHLDHLLAADYDPANKPGVATALLNELVESDSGVSRFTANALEQAPSGSGGDATEAKQDIIIAALAVVDATADAVLEDTGTTLPAQIAALDIGGGTGTYACTWTVNDGSTALEGAKVSFWLAGVLRGTGTTNASGQVSMSLDAGTYTVAISLSGYTFASTTHAVSSTASTWTKTFSMAAQTITAPSNPTDCACAWLCLDENDAPVAGVIIRARPDTDVTGTGYAWSGHTRDATSVAGTGLATINLPQGSKWWIRRDSGEEELFTVPATSTSTAVVSVRGGKRDTH